MSIETLPALLPARAPWNKGRIVGQKRPLFPKHVWSIRVRLEMAENKRDLALFNMAIDCKLRGCDLVCLKVNDVYAAGRVKERASVTQSKTRKPVRFGSPKLPFSRPRVLRVAARSACSAKASDMHLSLQTSSDEIRENAYLRFFLRPIQNGGTSPAMMQPKGSI